MEWSGFRSLLFYPLPPPLGRFERVGPELDLAQDPSLPQSGEGDDPRLNDTIGHTDIRNDLVALREQTVDRKFPATMRRVLCVDGDEVPAPADPLTRLGPFEEIV